MTRYAKNGLKKSLGGALAATALLLLLFSAARAASKSDPFSWSLESNELRVKPGEKGELRLSLAIPEDHYVYAKTVKIEPEEVEGVRFQAPVPPEAESYYDPFLKKEARVYTMDAQFSIPFEVDRNAAPGTHWVVIEVAHRGCKKGDICFRPGHDTLQAVIDVTGGGGAAQKSGAAGGTTGAPVAAAKAAAKDEGPAVDLFGPSCSPPGAATTGEGTLLSKLKTALVERTGLAYLLALLGGVLAFFTPCVFPLLPVYLRGIGTLKNKGRATAFLYTSCMVLGMAVTYCALGAVAAFSGKVFGSALSSPAANLILAALFFYLGATVLLGKDIVPSRLKTRLSGVDDSGYAGGFVLGVASGFMFTACTGPILGLLLPYVAQSGDAVYSVSVLFAFSLGLGLPFIIVGTFLPRLARGGARTRRWQVVLEELLAVAMLAFGLWWLIRALPGLRESLPASNLAVAVAAGLCLAGLLLGAVHKSLRESYYYDRQGELKTIAPSPKRKIAGLVVLSAGLVLLVHAGLDRPQPGPKWVRSEEAAFELARKQNKEVLVDFYTENCASCERLDEETFSNPRVIETLKEEYVPLKIDLTHEDAEKKSLADRYQVYGVPRFAVIKPSGQPAAGRHYNGFLPPEAFISCIEGGAQ